jgi:hypothetical protein
MKLSYGALALMSDEHSRDARGALLEVGCPVPAAIFPSGSFGAMPMPRRPRHV